MSRIIFIISLIGLSSLIYASEAKQPVTQQPYNIILIINDQETYKLQPAPNYRLPAREAIMQHGVTFDNHYTAAAMCSPSRATFLTGVPPQVNGVYDQEEYDFVPDLSPTRPNMGSVLKTLGYQTAYFGKFEMNKSLLLKVTDKTNYSTLAKPYGFDVFNPGGDVGGNPLQGYTTDNGFIGEAINWLRKNSTAHASAPFFMVVSLLNPHDIMYGDANLANTIQAQKPAIPAILPPPDNSLYAKNWNFELPPTLEESFIGMPAGLMQYQKGWSTVFGEIPTARKDMWHYYYNYYLNALRDNDNTLQQLVAALNEMDLWKNTIVILTADHGEMGGSHGGIRGKGPMVYEENAHIPLVIAHPAAPKSSYCNVLTSHLDLFPTVIGLTGISSAASHAAMHALPGHDFSAWVIKPNNADIHALRPGVLFNYVGISTIDSTFLINKFITAYKHEAEPALTQINLSNRGFMSFVFDGRYKFARYYAPNQFNTPSTIEQILKNNDVQLFDLQNDPLELTNLAESPEKYKDVILQMNKLLNDLMLKEVGNNDGSFLPKNVRPSTL